MRKALAIIIGIALLVVAVAVVGQRLWTRSTQELAPAAMNEFLSQQEVKFTATGVFVPARWEELSFSSSGQLEKLLVKEGDEVSAGQALASLSTYELELGLQLAKTELETQETTLSLLEQGASSAEFASAQAAYEASVAAYEKLKAGPSAEQIVIAQADLKQAEEAVHRAQSAYDAVKSLPDIGARHESIQLQSATIDYERAKAQFDLETAGPDKATLKQAESEVAAAKARLDGQSSELRLAQANVTRAKIELARSQLALDQATLHAPFTGTVTSVIARLGDVLGPGIGVLTVADLGEIQVETTDFDEWGIGATQPNQTVELWVPSLDNRNLRGRVVSVAVEPTVSSNGATLYKVIVALERQDPDLRWGMTVQIRFPKPTGNKSTGS